MAAALCQQPTSVELFALPSAPLEQQLTSAAATAAATWTAAPCTLTAAHLEQQLLLQSPTLKAATLDNVNVNVAPSSLSHGNSRLKSCLNRNANKSTQKKVIFADDVGQSLTRVRSISPRKHNPIPQPNAAQQLSTKQILGLLALQYANEARKQKELYNAVKKAAAAAAAAQAPLWAVNFKQPARASNYRQLLERNKICLECGIIRHEESLFIGHIRLYNLAYEKFVFARITWDNWQSFEDISCIYSYTGPTDESASCASYDMFFFTVKLPPKGRLQFCLCYRVNSMEYWDNNVYKNYSISTITN